MTDNESLRDYLERLYGIAKDNERTCREDLAALETRKATLIAEIKGYQMHQRQLQKAQELERQEAYSPVGDGPRLAVPCQCPDCRPKAGWTECPDCEGSGWNCTTDDACPACDGKGDIVPEESKIVCVPLPEIPESRRRDHPF